MTANGKEQQKLNELIKEEHPARIAREVLENHDKIVQEYQTEKQIRSRRKRNRKCTLNSLKLTLM